VEVAGAPERKGPEFLPLLFCRQLGFNLHLQPVHPKTSFAAVPAASKVVVLRLGESRQAPMYSSIANPSYVIVGLHVTLKRPFPLVGESELARESEMACFGLFCLLKNNIRN
jgi:hypothetical protein